MEKRYIYFLVFLLISSGCHYVSKKLQQKINLADTVKPKITKLVDTSVDYKHRYTTDSLYKIKMLAFALSYAGKRIDKDSFTYNTQQLSQDSGFLSMEFGHLFDNHYKHLVIRIPPSQAEHLSMDLPINIYLYLLKDGHFALLCNQTADSNYMDDFMSYQCDTIQDVNGDGFKDFVVNWYSAVGCCPRTLNRAFLYNPANGGVNKSMDFMNPWYSLKDKMLYQMDYGHPGHIGLYKSKWNGYKLDTLECVLADEKNENRFIIIDEHTHEQKTVKGLPEEYSHIPQIDWFLSAWGN